MSDTQIHPTGTVPVPADYKIPDSADLLLKSAFAHFDGSGAAGSYLPLMRIVSDAGSVVVEAVADTTIAAGASADASWFPHIAGAAATPAASGVPVVAFGVLNPSTQPNVPAGGSSFATFGTHLTSDSTKLAWGTSGVLPNDMVSFKNPAKGWAIIFASCTWPSGTKIDCRITPSGGFDQLHDGFDGMSGYDSHAAAFGPQLEDFTVMTFNVVGDIPVQVRLTNHDAGASAPTDVQLSITYFTGVIPV